MASSQHMFFPKKERERERKRKINSPHPPPAAAETAGTGQRRRQGRSRRSRRERARGGGRGKTKAPAPPRAGNVRARQRARGRKAHGDVQALRGGGGGKKGSRQAPNPPRAAEGTGGRRADTDYPGPTKPRAARRHNKRGTPGRDSGGRRSKAGAPHATRNHTAQTRGGRPAHRPSLETGEPTPAGPRRDPGRGHEPQDKEDATEGAHQTGTAEGAAERTRRPHADRPNTRRRGASRHSGRTDRQRPRAGEGRPGRRHEPRSERGRHRGRQRKRQRRTTAERRTPTRNGPPRNQKGTQQTTENTEPERPANAKKETGDRSLVAPPATGPATPPKLLRMDGAELIEESNEIRHRPARTPTDAAHERVSGGGRKGTPKVGVGRAKPPDLIYGRHDRRVAVGTDLGDDGVILRIGPDDCTKSFCN